LVDKRTVREPAGRWLDLIISETQIDHLPRDGTLGGDNVHMWIGWIEFDILLGDVHSLKEKRAVIRPIVAELRRKYEIAAAETGSLDLHRRAGIGASLVAADSKHVIDVLDAVEHFVSGRPEIELLSAQRKLARSDD